MRDGGGGLKPLSVAAHFENVLASGTVLPNVMCTPQRDTPSLPLKKP